MRPEDKISDKDLDNLLKIGDPIISSLVEEVRESRGKIAVAVDLLEDATDLHLDRAEVLKVLMDGPTKKRKPWGANDCPPEHRDKHGLHIAGTYEVCAKCFDSFYIEVPRV